MSGMWGCSVRKIRWLLRRLSLMSAAEVGYRLGTECRKRAHAVMAWMVKPPRARDLARGNELAPIRWFVDLDRREETVAQAVGKYGWVADRANNLLAHQMSVFALEDAALGDVIDWNRDYRSGTRAPLRFGLTMDYRDERLCGDIKYVWELSRHHHFVELAKAAYLTGSKTYADEVLAQALSWIDACPYPRGVHWSSSLENAIRVVNWSYALRLLVAGDRSFVSAHEDALRCWMGSIRQHLRFIHSNVSRYSSANNHLIGEACGLFVGAMSFNFPESPSWVREGRGILEDEIRKQTWDDGVNKEQAVHYQVFVFELFLVAGQLARRNGVDFSPRYWEILERMAEFVLTLVDDAGRVPAIGDDDDAHVLILSCSATTTPYQSLLAAAAAIFNRADFRERSAGYGEQEFWLLGPDGQRAFDAAERVPERRMAFPEGGYYILAEEDSWLLFDCGPLGYLSLAAHGHADALSVCLRYKGKDFLIDPGTYVYHTQRVWRDYFRGTSAHNTARVDGVDQSVGGGTFLWHMKAQSQLLEYSPHHVRGEHNGYQRLSEPVTHVREVTYEEEKKQYTVTDALEPGGSHLVELFFHFAADVSVELVSAVAYAERDGVRIAVKPDAGAEGLTLVRGSGDPILGWTSPGYDRKVPSSTLVCRFSTSGAATMRTVIQLL